MTETKQIYRVQSNSVESINFILNLLSDRLDELEGLRGTPTFKSDVDMDDHAIINLDVIGDKNNEHVKISPTALQIKDGDTIHFELSDGKITITGASSWTLDPGSDITLKSSTEGDHAVLIFVADTRTFNFGAVFDKDMLVCYPDTIKKGDVTFGYDGGSTAKPFANFSVYTSEGIILRASNTNNAYISLDEDEDDRILIHLLTSSEAGTTYVKVTGSLIITGDVIIQEVLKILEKSIDPPEPNEGESIIWMSNGNGKGDDGDVMVASKVGGTTKYGTLFDHSGGGAW